MTTNDRIVNAQKMFGYLKSGSVDLDGFSRHLARHDLTPADIGETPESVDAADLEGRILLAHASHGLMKQGHITNDRFMDRLAQLQLTLTDIGESEETVAAASS